MAKIYNTQEAAEQLGRSRRSVQRYCADMSIGQKVGRDVILTAQDIRELRRRLPKMGQPPKSEHAAK